VVNELQARETAAAVLMLHPEDNVVVCRRDVRAGETLVIGSEMLTAASDVALGHKIARRLIRRNSQVIKYGMSIGVSTSEIQPGEWVHLHNIRSNYIASHARDSEEPR
jgi:(2R)-sulfolactate sulfo-lyase subunit alpha